MADAPYLKRAVTLNPSIPRLIGSVSSNKNTNMSFGECAKVEAVANQGFEAQSMAFWVFNGILVWLKQEGFKPGDPQMFEELIQAFSLSMVNSTSAFANLATFLQAKRRESILKHFPGHVGEHHRAQLLASDYSGDLPFEDDVLKKVLAESREDSTVSANVAISKGFSFPVFGKVGKAEGKSTSLVAPKSPGKGKCKGGFNLNKRRAQGQGQGSNIKAPKSPKGGSASGDSAPNKGRGFQK